MNPQIVNYLKSKGNTVIDENIDDKLETWEQWYRGHVDRFHSYKIYEGQKNLNQKRRTLNMAARVCQDWADLLLNEKVELSASDKYTEEVLHRLLEQVNFYVRGNNLIEAAFAKGGGFLIQYWDGIKVNQKYITQDKFYPISFDSGKVTEAAFASEITVKGQTYTYLETHTKDENGFYVVENNILKSESQSISEMPEMYEELGLDQYIYTLSKTPTFQQIRPNIANKDKFDSPYGTSVFAGATDVLEGVDIVYDAYVKEILLGRKRIFARDSVTNVHIMENGRTVKVFDPSDEVFYLLPENKDDPSAPPIIESNMQLRVTELDAAMQTQLNLLSQACGFGANGYKWDSGNVSTATQVISENSKMFRTLHKHESVLRTAIIDMAHSLLNFEAIYNGDKSIDLNATITVDFDDSIIEDTAEIKRQAMLEFNAGLIDAIEYYKQIYKLDEEQAKSFYNEMLQRKPEVEEEPEGA